MKNNIVIAVFLFCISSFVDGQTLFTYGYNSVSKDEFLAAFNKNSNGTKPTEKALRDYLDLYTRYKLKVKAAYDLRLDSGAGQIAELSDFRP